MLSRFVPAGVNAFGATVGTEAFPAVYAQRRDNRGFEAIAVWQDKIYCFVQSPLDNPDVANDANSKASRNIRIAKFDPTTNSVTAEYIYVLEGGASDKIGDAHAFGPGKFLVVERDSALGSSSLKKIFEINLAGATDISTLSPAIAGPGGTLDKMTPAQLAAAGIVPVTKTVHVDLAAIGGLPAVAGALTRLKAAFAHERVSDVDGVRIDFADGWVHLRASNTEPIARIIAEAPTRERARELIAVCTKAAGL
jgi:3-phytase